MVALPPIICEDWSRACLVLLGQEVFVEASLSACCLQFLEEAAYSDR